MSYYLQNMVDDNALGYQRSKGEKKPVQRAPRWYRSVYEVAIMRALAAFADDHGGSCFPSVATLADECQCSQRKVKSVLKEFRTRGLIRIKHTGRSNRYQILPHGFVVPKPADSEQSAKKAVYSGNAGEAQNSREIGAPRAPEKRAHQKSPPYTSAVNADHLRSARPAHEYYQLNSSTTHRQIVSLSLTHARERDSADALRERENPHSHQGAGKKEEGIQEETSLVTNPKKARAGVVTPLDCEGDGESCPPAARLGSEVNATAQCCACDSKHPPGMPSLQEIRAEMRKLRPPDGETEEHWLNREVEELHDAWLSTGFQTKSGPIRDWKASLRNWKRWRENGGASVFG
jgi:hypothetical protein